MRLNQPRQEHNNSAKPLILGLIAIFVLMGLFVLKSYQSDKTDPQNNAAQTGTDDGKLDVPLIQPEEVTKLILNTKYQLVDIREKPLFDQQHIESSTNIPFSTIGNNAKLFQKSKKIIIIDEVTTEQGKILTDHLIKEGLDAKYMDGGIQNYYLKSLPIVSFGDPDSLRDQAKATALTAAELQTRSAKGESFTFLDVRSASTFQNSHIEGAVNIPLEELEKRKNDIPTGTKLITCDENPMRSFQAAVKLHDMNYWGVYYLSDSLTKLKEVVANPAAAAPAATPGAPDNTQPAAVGTATTQPATSQPGTLPSTTLPAQQSTTAPAQQTTNPQQ